MIFMTQKRLLNLRRRTKRRQPKFVRQETHSLKRLSKSWRRPTGMTSKIRHRFKGNCARPAIGRRGPIEVRGLMQDGRTLVRVTNLKQMQQLNPKTDAALIASAVGKKLRLQLLTLAADRGIPVEN